MHCRIQLLREMNRLIFMSPCSGRIYFSTLAKHKRILCINLNAYVCDKKHAFSFPHFLTSKIPQSDIGICIDKVAHGIASSKQMRYDTSRVQRTSQLIQTLLSMNSHDQQFKDLNTETTVEEKSIIKFGETRNRLDLAVEELVMKSRECNRQFSGNLKIIVASIQKHEFLTNGAEDIENVTAILKSILYGNLGFGLKTVIRLLHYYPEIFQIDQNVIHNRIENLRRQKLSEGFLQRVLSHSPHILTLSEDEVVKKTNFLVNDLDFTSAELPQLFLFSPEVFFEPKEKTEEKFQYIYFTMGYRKFYILARHGILRYNVQHVRIRHLFLERRGQYQLPDINQNTTIENPKLKMIVCTKDENFCLNVAHCSLEEFQFFKDIIQVEDSLRIEEASTSDIETRDLADHFLEQMKK